MKYKSLSNHFSYSYLRITPLSVQYSCKQMILAFKFGDPYGNWTHDSAVKGRCLNLLTNGPYLVAAVGFEPTTNRVWTEYSSQLSYAAIFSFFSLPLHATFILYTRLQKKSTLFFTFSLICNNSQITHCQIMHNHEFKIKFSLICMF